MTEPAGTLIKALQQPKVYHHAVENLTLIETHISWLVLTGPYAYKIKKPLNLGFLDFSTLDKRRHYCHEELRLNRRLAPEIYLEVVPISGSPAHPRLGGADTPIEYAVKMVQFPQQARLDYCLQRGELSPKLIENLAHKVAAFHQSIAIAPQDSPYGTPEAVLQPALENFEQVNSFLEEEKEDQKRLARLRQWTEEKWRQLQPEFIGRKKAGFVRECHGDLHLGNIALRESQFIIFDCIEFNENLRWIDVMSELAFLVMDLEDRGRPDLAHHCLNRYLERSGDYPGLAVLGYYQVYRALVRAKVTAIRLGQTPSAPEAQAIKERYRSYLKLASSYIQPAQTFLIITHGLSGSGKTTLSQPLLDHLGAIRLRSDIERKRLHGLNPRDRPGEGVATGMYSAQSSRQTYQHLQQLAQTVLAAGYPVLVDAAFLKQAQRQAFQDLAQTLGVPFAILDFRCEPQQLQQRIRERQRQDRDASDADLAVLEHQQTTQEPLTEAEQNITLPIETSQPLDMESLREQLLHQLHPTP
ncbi:aminoglycoside phosphotransferase [Nitrosococcus halophilus Nc 4]|uniref:Aminoglycoside phosphotransferase n=1 Tax=Nitrosococcus halophilus (strain Nc4) TaxID=472759 RepID=D5BUN2_NITHN|nr:bifunctional aminoglycoside phosphotransferase/ATP-binding protein [Nitrosococcus halophilus]ADE13432.1 aminoglycoside phosphotransferase [Nitrosococcus halophilus Nc 4]